MEATINKQVFENWSKYQETNVLKVEVNIKIANMFSTYATTGTFAKKKNQKKLAILKFGKMFMMTVIPFLTWSGKCQLIPYISLTFFFFF